VLLVALILAPASADAQQEAGKTEKPNILVIMGDDIGIPNLSIYSHGMMGYKTPNIDRIGREGMLFTDYYAEQSCTAGRAAFITGQTVLRTGLSRVGMPGSDVGLQDKDPTLAELLKPHGYMTGQFGKNHLGDLDKFLPTKHGFDEFFGNLYHLNAEEEPEHVDYPKDPRFRKKFGPRGVIKSSADGKIEDTGPLTKKRMETVDKEFLDAAVNFIERAHKAKKPFFVWFASSRMHFFTHVPKEWQGKSGLNFYADGMLQHDHQVGLLLKKLDDLGIADNTIVLYTGDNGPHACTWPDAAVTWFRSEKVTNWEGAYRVPMLVRWPGKIKPGSVSNEIISALDWVPTLMAAAGDADTKEKLKKGHKVAGKTFKVHLDGYNFLPYLNGTEKKGPRKEFFYFNDDAQLTGLRFDRWKLVFQEQRAEGMAVWRDPYWVLRSPKLFDLRMDPFEKADHDSNTYEDWWMRHAFVAVPVQAYVANYLKTFKEFPPSQKPAVFNLDRVMDLLQQGGTH